MGSWIEIEALMIAIALGTDAFSVAVGVGTKCFRLQKIIFVSFIIGIFHIFMPLLGYFGGDLGKSLIARYFLVNTGSVDYIFDLIGAGLLLLIGVYMIIESRMEDDQIPSFNLKGWGVVAIAISVSIDSLSVGISLSMMGYHILVVLLFGLVAALMMAAGLLLGSKIGHWLGDNAQVFGGLVLLYLGFHFIGFI